MIVYVVLHSMHVYCFFLNIFLVLAFRQSSIDILLCVLLPARRRPQGLVVIGVCLSVCLCVCLCALCLSARYLKNRFMDHHQIWWVGAGGEPLEQVQFWC